MKIRLGIDPISGLDASYSLPVDLRDYLADYGITYLAQAQKQDGFSQGFNAWYLASDLDLGGDWADLWTSFVKGLSHGGIKIRNFEDSLLWMYDKKSGTVITKKAYEFIVSEYFPMSLDCILSQVWKFNIP